MVAEAPSPSLGLTVHKLPGASIDQAATDACWLASLLKVQVEFVYEGLKFEVRPGDTANDVEHWYYERLVDRDDHEERRARSRREGRTL